MPDWKFDKSELQVNGKWKATARLPGVMRYGCDLGLCAEHEDRGEAESALRLFIEQNDCREVQSAVEQSNGAGVIFK